MPRRAHPRLRPGFTLIEALAAGVILAAFGAAIALGMNQSLRALERARDTQRAAELLDLAATRIDAIGPDRLMRQGPLSGRFDPPHQRFSFQTEISSLPVGNLYAVKITVSWRDAAGRHSAELATRLNDPPGSRPGGLAWEDL